ncbi:MAG TPA: ester cyclase [Myxococcaceae bacterium]|nr:ester cyclase [Myxococcaceae bacterium]
MSRYLLPLVLALAACGGMPPADVEQDVTAGAQADAIELNKSGCTKTELANRELLHQYHVTIWEQGRWDLLGNFVAPDFFSHAVPVLPNGQVPGYDWMNQFLGAFSNLSSHEDAIMSGGDRVSIQWTITATQTGDFFGIPPTGRTITFSGMDALRVSNGKFVEHWGGIADQVDEVAAKLTAP